MAVCKKMSVHLVWHNSSLLMVWFLTICMKFWANFELVPSYEIYARLRSFTEAIICGFAKWFDFWFFSGPCGVNRHKHHWRILIKCIDEPIQRLVNRSSLGPALVLALSHLQMTVKAHLALKGLSGSLLRIRFLRSGTLSIFDLRPEFFSPCRPQPLTCSSAVSLFIACLLVCSKWATKLCMWKNTVCRSPCSWNEPCFAVT